jgi:peptidyl-dipeptidase A
MLRILTTLTLLGAAASSSALAQSRPADDEHAFAALRDAYLAKYKPLWLTQAAAWWEANITGKDEAYARKDAADAALVDLHSDHATFEQLKGFRDRKQIQDPVLRRELTTMYLSFLPGQADPQLQKKITTLENAVEKTFNTFRSQVGDRTLTENDVRETLAKTKDSAAAEAAWKAYMEVGRAAEPQLRELVGLRNDLARQIGMPSYYELQLTLQEIDPNELQQLFDELDKLTAKPFAAMKADMDKQRAARFGIEVSQLRPWHYGDLFFQEAPTDAGVDLDALFEKTDLLAIGKRYYASIGLPVDEILQRSDLYEKPGKCPHAFSHDIDRAGGVMILINLKPNIYWANTLLHELGHAVYDRYVRPDVPFLLHTASHGLTTEGIAEMFGAFVKNEDWLTHELALDPATAARVGPAVRESLRTERLMFCRWAQVMLRFEREMYTHPDQDLAKLWWNLKKRYQLLNPPDRIDQPDYAAKVHVLTTPVYYHCYMMGELFASQVRHCINHDVLKVADGANPSYVDHPEVGTYLKDKVFGPGAEYSWRELTEYATGAPLSPKAFSRDVLPTQ